MLVFMQTPTYGSVDRITRERNVTSLILLQLTKYIKFPDQADRKVINCVLKDKNVYNELLELQHKQAIISKNIEARYIESANNFEGCNLIYASSKEDAQELIRQTLNKTVVTISNYDQFIDEGGVIGIVDQSGILSLQLNLVVAEERRLNFSLELVEIAVRIIQ